MWLLFIMCIFITLYGCGRTSDYNITTEQITSQQMEHTDAEITEKITENIGTESGAEKSTTEERNPRENILIALDPGHQAPSVDMSATEPNAPGSSVMKAKATSGTTGRFTGVGEYELNLTIAKKAKNKLSELGYNVVMTREDNETAISNMERARLANDLQADISVRIHANGSDDISTNGALVLVGSQKNPYVGELYEDSYRLGSEILNAYCALTGMKSLGIQTNDTMTGINWSEIPVIILEMGFMTNEQDDNNMQDGNYQETMVDGIVMGIENYFGMESADSKIGNGNDLQTILDRAIDDFGQTGGMASVCVEDLDTGNITSVGNKSMVAASIIKLYIAGCIYELQEKEPGSAPTDVDELIRKMITVSDNDATNALVMELGNGDSAEGMNKVNTYCSRHGLTDSSMGRLMLDFDSETENYTSVKDASAFLRSVYNRKIAGADKILSYLKQQERTNKIPAGVPASVQTANKTGELESVENDVAIVFSDHPYVISIMTDNVIDTSAARNWIVDLSAQVYDYFK